MSSISDHGPCTCTYTRVGRAVRLRNLGSRTWPLSRADARGACVRASEGTSSSSETSPPGLRPDPARESARGRAGDAGCPPRSPGVPGPWTRWLAGPRSHCLCGTSMCPLATGESGEHRRCAMRHNPQSDTLYNAVTIETAAYKAVYRRTRCIQMIWLLGGGHFRSQKRLNTVRLKTERIQLHNTYCNYSLYY